MEDSVNPHGGLTDGKGREGKGKGSNPTLYAHKGNVFQEPQYLPGVDIPIGKFAMHDLWLPSQDWPRLAATWGIALPEYGIPADRAGRVHRVLEIRGESVHSGSVGAEICPQRDKCQSQIQTTTSNRR